MYVIIDVLTLLDFVRKTYKKLVLPDSEIISMTARSHEIDVSSASRVR